jgi:hypothetical protein
VKSSPLAYRKQLPSPFFSKETQKTTLQDDINFYKEQIYYYRDCIERIKQDAAQRIKNYYIEPVLRWSYTELFLASIKEIGPERVYIGYDTKRTKLMEPRLKQVLELMKELAKFTKVKPKLLREPWNYRLSNLEAYH